VKAETTRDGHHRRGWKQSWVGKTSLVCGLISALKEFSWNAVKITTLEPAPGSHSTLRPIPQQAPDSSTVHSQDNRLWEETRAGEENDTERYLAAGAARSFLAIPSTTGDPPTPRLGDLLNELWRISGEAAALSSNRIAWCITFTPTFA